MLLPLLNLLVVLAAPAAAVQATSTADAALRTQVEVVNLLLANESADDFYVQGVAARDAEQIGPALIAFLAAFRLDDSRFEIAYEIARLFTAWDEPELGQSWLERAVAGGYWSEWRLQRDGVLAPLRTRPGFAELVQRARANYDAALPSLLGMTVVRRPAGSAPAEGWPLLVCLHGYGTDHNDLVSVAEVAATEGFVAITISGYQPVSPGRHAWPNEGPAIATYIKEVLEPFRSDPDCDAERVFTTGFSQGGLVATYLVATEPERFRGALPISPAGPLSVPAPHAARPLFVLYGAAEGAGVHDNVRRFRAEFEQRGGRVRVETHAGGHELPAGWSDAVRRGLTFLRD